MKTDIQKQKNEECNEYISEGIAELGTFIVNVFFAFICGSNSQHPISS